MKKYMLTDGQIANMKIFLARTSLSGEEVAAYNQVVEAINSPQKDRTDGEVITNATTEVLEAELNTREPVPEEDEFEEIEEVQTVKIKVPKKKKSTKK